MIPFNLYSPPANWTPRQRIAVSHLASVFHSAYPYLQMEEQSIIQNPMNPPSPCQETIAAIHQHMLESAIDHARQANIPPNLKLFRLARRYI